MINIVVPRVHIKCCDNHSSNMWSIVHGVRSKRKMASLHLGVPEHLDFCSPLIYLDGKRGSNNLVLPLGW